MNITAIDNELAVQKIYQFFCNSIISGDLKPGDMLPSEGQLAEMFSVGRGTLREAKKMLAAVGVLEERRGQGSFVATKAKPEMFNPLLFSMIIDAQSPESGNPDKNREIYELRIMFETAAMELVIDKASDEQLGQVKHCVDESQLAFENGVQDTSFYIDQEYIFHSKIYEVTGNALIIRIGNMINELFRQGMVKSLNTRHGVERCIKNHYKICESLCRRDKAAMKAAVYESLTD